MLETYSRRLLWGVIGGLILRLTYITLPLLEVEPLAQTQMAWLARDLYLGHFHRSVLFYDFAHSTVYPYLLGLTYILTGNVHEWGGRLLAIMFGLASLRFLFLWTKMMLGRKEAIWACLVYWLSPLSILYTRVYLPESAIVCCSLGALYYMHCWTSHGGRWEWLWSTLLCACAMLLRPSSCYLMVPLVYQLYRKNRREFLWQKQIWVLCFVPFFLVGIWQYLTQGDTGQGHALLGGDLWRFFSLDLLISGRYWEKMFGFLAGKTLTPLGFFFFFWALWKNRKEDLGVVPIWMGSFGIYLLLMTDQTGVREKFYLLPFLAMASIYIGAELGKGEMGFSKEVAKWIKTTVNVILIISVVMQLSRAYSLSEHYRYTQEAGEDLQNYAEKDDLVIATRRLYYCHRQGWTINLFKGLDTKHLITEFEAYRAQGARYFVMTEVENYGHHKDFLNHILDTCEEIMVAKGYRIYRL